MSFAAIDFETTGFVPERTDRVVEVGIVLADDGGRIEQEWTTLVNPCRDVGASHIHGITASDVLDAPTFTDIGDSVLELLSGRVVVAHNATFDMRFLRCELERAGYPILERPAALCSMKWANRIIGAGKLAHCCEAFGIPLDGAHSALCDARATAQLMAHLTALCGEFQEWIEEGQRCLDYRWPLRLGMTPATLVHRGQAAPDPYDWLHSVLAAAWLPGIREDEAAYLSVLESALLDRAISRTEGRELLAAAEGAGLRPETARRLHEDYLRAVAVEALADGVVTADEHRDLESVARALGLSGGAVDDALKWAVATSAGAPAAASKFLLNPGDRVVFTGDMTRSRDEWIADIAAAGLTSGGVTKATRVVVAADPDSLSRKAATARKYGIPVVDETTFKRFFAEYRAQTAEAFQASATTQLAWP